MHEKSGMSIGGIVALIVLAWVLFAASSSDADEPYRSDTTSYTNSDGSTTWRNTDNYGTFECTFSADYSSSTCGDK